MVHIDSHDSPMYEPELSDVQRVQRLINISDSRIHYLSQKTANKNVSLFDLKPGFRAPLPVYKQNFQYFVKIGLGSFPTDDPKFLKFHHEYLALDNRGSIIWTQCEGCQNCFYQKSSLFPWRDSKTYHLIPCNECPECICENDIAIIGVPFRSTRAMMKGVMSRESFAFGTPETFLAVVRGIKFTCIISMPNVQPEDSADNKITGILGMNRGPNSLISQIGPLVNYKFSYCLQDYRNPATSTFLYFGDHIINRPNMFVTPLLTRPNLFHYYVTLNDIGVNGRKLNIPSHLFELNPDNSGGTLMDLIASFTFLVPDAFDILVEAITDYILNNNLYIRKRQGGDINEKACWEPLFDSPTFDLPTITYYLDNNAELLIQSTELFWVYPTEGVPQPGLYCLTIRRNKIYQTTNILGSFAQVNQRMIFDLAKSKLSFIAEDCTNAARA
ncbi:hypothetical protein RND81_01G022000 [Saponaria officinalis]|uniref:Peptidase A1 domain-containing protein n=1 Tax=Saponaria officinalis TaxID=3572 RepID=A0AAW1NB01_SAPOF